MWNGIKSVGEWLGKKISGFMSGITDGIKEFFGIHSPSKLFSDEIGKMLPPGITVGFKSAMPKAIKDINGSLDVMVGKMQGSVAASQSRIGAEMAGSIPSVTTSDSNESKVLEKLDAIERATRLNKDTYIDSEKSKQGNRKRLRRCIGAKTNFD